MGLSLKKPAGRSPSGSSHLSLLLLASLFGCGGTPRFAPLPDEELPPPRRALLPGEEVEGISSPTGELPLAYPPSLRCLTVGPNGKTTLPPLGPLRPVGSYADDLVCQVRLLPSGASGATYDRLALFIRAANGARIPMTEISLRPGPDGVCDHLLWFGAKEWRPVTRDHTHLTVEAVALCDPATAPEGDDACALHLVQSIPLIEAAPPLPEDQKIPRNKQGPSVLDIVCAPYTPAGRPASPLKESHTLPLGGLRCALTIENPTDEVIKGALAEIRAGPYEWSARRAAARAVPELLPKSRLSLQLHLPALPTSPGPFSLVAAAGRNRTERARSEKAISLKLKEAPPPQTQPQ